MNFRKTVSGYALLYTLIISTIICLIASYLLLTLMNSKALASKSETRARLYHTQKSLLRLGLNRNFRQREHLEIKLYENIGSTIKTENWAAYDILILKSNCPSDSIMTAAFIGNRDYSYRNTAFFMADKKQPLNISGQSQIRGDAYLPEKGIRKALVNGQIFLGNETIIGEKLKSSKVIPELNVPGLDNFLYRFNTDQFDLIGYKDSLENSFSNEAVHLHFGDSVYLDGQFYKGHIILSAKEKIIISSNIYLEDLIIIAPEIEVMQGSNITAQLVAEEEVNIAENVVLNYPSMIYNDNKSGNGHIRIAQNSKVNGLILARKNTKEENEVLISLGQNSEIKGLCYSDGIIECKGNIIGTLFCDNIQFSDNGSTYRSYLYNSIIDNNVLPQYFVLPELFGKVAKKKVIKWVD